MGVIKRGILGGFSGSVGNVVGSSWKGIATMKAKPLSVANPNTAGQIAQRSKMTNIVAFVSTILTTIIKPLNDRFASSMSGFNLFTQRNISLFTDAVPANGAALELSKGGVAGFSALAVTADVSNDEVAFVYADNTGDGNALGTDVFFGVAWNHARGTMSSATGATRADLGEELVLPDGTLAGDTVSYAISFRRADGTQVSDTTTGSVVAVA